MHDTLGVEPAHMTLDVMEDRLRVILPPESYHIADVMALARYTGRMYEVSETVATGTVDFMDNPERAGREDRVPHTGGEILGRACLVSGTGPEDT